MIYYYEGLVRLDWGFENPNITAALIVQLMMLAWLPAFLPYFKSKKLGVSVGFIISICLVSYLGHQLLQTYSRGGVIAAMIGHLFLMGFAVSKVFQRSAILPCVLIGLMGLKLFHQGHQIDFNQRLNQATGLQGELIDKGTETRWVMYQRIPSMLFDAPEGWGNDSKKVVDAYYHYYQPIDRSVEYLNLLSGHFTKLAQWGWFKRALYMSIWIMALVISCPIIRASSLFLMRIKTATDWNGAVFSCVLSLAVADLFSDVTSAVMIYLPSLVGVLMVVLLCKKKYFLHIKRMILCGAFLFLSIMGVMLVFHLNYQQKSIPVHYEGGCLELGTQTNYWIVNPHDEKAIFDNWGKAVRKSSFSCRFYDTWNDVPHYIPDDVYVIMAGRQAINLKETTTWPSNIILINPGLSPEEFQGFVKIDQLKTINILWGDFYNHVYKNDWELFSQSNSNTFFSIIPNASKYVENLPDTIRLAKSL